MYTQLLCDTYWARQTKSVRVHYEKCWKRATEAGIMRTYRPECKPAQILGSSNSAIVLDLLKFSSLDRTSEQRAVSERISLPQRPCWRNRSPYSGRPRRDDPAAARYTRRSRSTTQTRDVIHVWRHKSQQANLQSCVCITCILHHYFMLIIYLSSHDAIHHIQRAAHAQCRTLVRFLQQNARRCASLRMRKRLVVWNSSFMKSQYDKFTVDTCRHTSSRNVNMSCSTAALFFKLSYSSRQWTLNSVLQAILALLLKCLVFSTIIFIMHSSRSIDKSFLNR